MMEEFRLSPLRQTSVKSSLSGRSTPRGYRGSAGVEGGGASQWFRSSWLVYWLLLFTLWTYIVFYVQSSWDNDNDRKVEFLRFDVSLNKKEEDVVSRRSLSSRHGSSKQKVVNRVPDLPLTNATYGKLIGPFGSIEDEVLEWNKHRKTSGTCDRNSDLKRFVWSKRFVLVFHELSMTGAPISMMELASELMSCGATVSVVVLNRRGGLMEELIRRRIKVVEDKREVSFKTAMKSDLVIAGSAVCASWIDQYIDRYPAVGGSQVAWWIMENRREYFDRAKPVLDRVKTLVFLSESQSKQWLTWCEEEHIKVRSQPVIVPLSVNDELAFVAGIPCSLNTPTLSPEKMREKRQLLRQAVRTELGLTDEDMFVMSLSSITPGKGQLLLLEAISLALSLTVDNGVRRQKQEELKVLLGSVGSKSNKVGYVKEMLSFLSNNGNLSNSVTWTPATTRVASLYSAADVYVTNSQGVGETFGRVTIEAMAYGLAVVGTDAGGTKEIVQHNVTGLLHSTGRSGNEELAHNLLLLLRNPDMRLRFGNEGRKMVEKMYMKQHMYKRFVNVLVKCMKL